MKKLFFLFFLCCLVSKTFAAQDLYHFDQPAQQYRFDNLTTELRCLVCQNQNLAESNAALANDLRDQIYQQILKGQTDKQIVNYLVSRYGDFILYRPPINLATLGLWFGPLLLLMMGLGYLFYYVKKTENKTK